MAKKDKPVRVKMDTAIFEDVWVSLHDADGKDSEKYTMEKFMALLGPRLNIPVGKLNESSVRSKCYNLNKKATELGYAKLAVPGSGKQRKTVAWGTVFGGRSKAKK